MKESRLSELLARVMIFLISVPLPEEDFEQGALGLCALVEGRGRAGRSIGEARASGGGCPDGFALGDLVLVMVGEASRGAARLEELGERHEQIELARAK